MIVRSVKETLDLFAILTMGILDSVISADQIFMTVVITLPFLNFVDCKSVTEFVEVHLV